MGWKTLFLCVVLCTGIYSSPFQDDSSFDRRAVETRPPHEPIATPVRASVESVPLRNLRDESEGRLPLRDAVEKRPIPALDQESLYRFVQDANKSAKDVEQFRKYYGAAHYLNNVSRHTDERLQQGNANLQEMQQINGANSRRLVVCYLESWAAYRAPPLAFTSSLVPKSCTHLHYAFAVLHPHTYHVISANEDYDFIKGGYRIATGLKRRIPGLRVLLSVGGDGTERLFSEMVQEPYRRNSFTDSAVNFLREHDFDGLDLHWVYAGEKDEKEKELLTTLLYELREKFSSYGFLLSTVLPPFRYQIEDGYDLSAVSGATDYTILQAWDMTHAKRDDPPTRAIQHSALHRDPGAAARDQRYDNVEFLVKYVLRHGMAAEKLVLGVPLFGRSYTLAASTLPAPGAAVSGWGDEGVYTQTKGMLAYFEICMGEREGKGVSGVDEAGNAFAVFDNQWISYDSPNTIAEKVKFITSMGLAGAAAWAIDMDDFRGLCGSPFPLLSAISVSLNGEATQIDQSSLKIGSCESNTPYLASDQESCAHFHFCTGGISFRMVCEEDRLYDPSTGYCGHQDVTKCIPGQSLRISVEDAARFLSTNYDHDVEWQREPEKGLPVESIHSALAESKKGGDNGKKVVCYMTSWAFYRRGDGKFVPEQIDTRLCTHVIYAYASLTPDDLIAKEFDPWADITNNLYERVTSLSDVKVLLGLGGWTDSAGDKYSRLVSGPVARAKFIEKLIPFLRNHNFKGLHLDWNYPVCWQSNCKKGAMSDKTNFAKFVKELSKSLHGAGMELGVALSGYKEVIETAYDLPTISGAADFMSTMTYDYHGGWERTTAHHTPLLSPKNEALSYYSIEYAIKALVGGGADPKKLLLGLAFYGQSYRLADVEGSRSSGSPAAGPGESGEFTKQPGMLAYYEVCYRVKNLRWKTGRQEKAGPYAYSDNQWVGYDDPKSITEKVEWALRQGLGGVTTWAMDLDDFNNRCCNEPSPLLRAANRALGRAVPAPPTTPCERPPEPVTPAPPTTTPAESDGSAGAGGDHGSHDHGSHTSTTWPSWNPSQTTSQTWWPPATTQMVTTSQRPTTTQKPTTTTQRTTTTTKGYPTIDTGIEGSPCDAGEFKAAPGDCEAYLQCESGAWRKHRCAPGLHWSTRAKRCDWPSFAQCTATSVTESSPATTTLAPITSRPPPTRPTTTTTTLRPTTTTWSTTTTRRTTTTRTTTASSGGISENQACNGQDYQPAVGDCNSYLHCDGTVWRLQSCAPGLHWSATQKHCDWPKYANCAPSDTTQAATTMTPTTRYTWATRPPSSTITANKQPQAGDACGPTDVHAASSSCESYLLCVSGKWSKQQCPQGLHWDRRSNRCDWKEFAMCEAAQRITTKSPFQQIISSTTQRRTTTARYTTPSRYTTTRYTTTSRPTTTRRPSSTTTRRTVVPTQQYPKPTRCRTGTYHPHPRCEKFYVCVNGVLVTQSCAPGLVWRHETSQCDFPDRNSCSDRRQVGSVSEPNKPNAEIQVEPEPVCENGQYAKDPNDCSRYLHCLFGKYEEFSCAAGLHWNQERQICDWPLNVKCDVKKVSTTTTVSIIENTNEQESVQNNPVVSSPSVDLVDEALRPQLINSRYKLVCYYTNWSWYRPGLGTFTPEDIDPSLCTHIVYGFAVLGDDGLMVAHDPWADYENRFYERVVDFKKYGTKVSIALGGWKDSAGDKYSKLVNDPVARARFVKHALEFVMKNGFDGLDLDWEYPRCWQVDCSKGPDSDKEAFGELIRELSAVFKPRGLLLSSAVSPSKVVIDAGYDVPVLAKYLDWVAVMTYDYHGQWDGKTGHVAPLYYHPDDDNTYFNANYTMHYWISKGTPPSKLVMGMPLYGQTFTTSRGDNRRVQGLNAPALAGGEAGEYTQASGFLAYHEICDRIKNRNWEVVKDSQQRMGPYAFKGDQWVSYDDVDIIKNKVNFIKSLGLGGGMVWALDLDDFMNRCAQGKYPLMNAIKDTLLNPNVEPDTVLAEALPEPQNDIDYDLEDIEVRPSYSKPTMKPSTMVTARPTDRPTTTQKPTTALVNMDEVEQYKVVCYYTNWAWYRPGSGKFTPSEIDPTLCTHIIYAFAVLDSTQLVLKPHDNWLDVENKFYEKVIALKSSGVKVLLGLGGWNDSAGDKYSRLVNNVNNRRKFVVHALDFLNQYEFDGLDLDWEYPKCWQVECEKGPASDKQGFTELVKELRGAFSRKGLLLSAAVSASKRVIDYAYDVPSLSQNLDWISLMTYDYHGQWDQKTGHVAPMYAGDDDQDKTFNVNFTVNYWMSKGAPRSKLILGIPFYGQSFSLMENGGNSLGAPTYAGGEGGDETRARGFLAFYEICERIRVHGWKLHRDAGGRMGPYATLNDQWVSFDDDFMIRHKAEFIRSMELGGSMVWSLDLDDFSGKYCGCGKSPLLSTINYVLREREAPPQCDLNEIESPPNTEDTADIPVNVGTTAIESTTVVLADPVVEMEVEENGSMEDRPCSGVSFLAHSTDCSKYYLCINGRYSQLVCPQPLYWNQNHCDWPERSPCKSKANLRLTSEKDNFIITEKPIVACYFTNWAYYRRDVGSFGPEQVDSSLCSHLVYSWAYVNNTFSLVPGNQELDVVNDFYGKLTNYKRKGLKVILGVGGIEHSESDAWHKMVASEDNRKIFVKSVVKFLRTWNFDGLQVAWQYPACKDIPSCQDFDLTERNNFSQLLIQLAKSLRRYNLELSAMVSPVPEIAEVAYSPEVLTGTMDWIAIAANDFYTTSKKRTSYLLPLDDAGDNTDNFQSIISYWSSKIPNRQLVLSVPAYGRSYTLRRETGAATEAGILGAGVPGPYTDVPGFLAYYEICNATKSNWREVSSPSGTFATQGTQWVTYLKPEEVHRISATVSLRGMRGAALWALDLDDYRGTCSCNWPLLTALRQGLFEPSLPYAACA
ncbi:probable chitinase 10 isoform X2 [Leptidea sinapis]|uniref:probable chitinase 10 isoform X2 n=1 Tax=Leptidea sinapis TaxID=189913 RepID=UPI0021C3FD37|nr:probable chitinase 10 isoform X2 [Leptidea sinapis]